ncbi:MAG: hypothetical protein HY814_13475 [Candidatus Riflebacteria bacterium]|nr:hypothetical protein [Candidatus Riflebacteria bacterium]
MRNRVAISLIEIVVAVVFLAIALMPLLGLLIAGHQGTAMTLHQTQAFHLADDIVEAVGALPFTKVDSGLPAELDRVMPLPAPPGGPSPYKRTVEVLATVETPTADGKATVRVRPVVVTIVWDGVGDEERRTIRLTALATEVQR